MRFQSPLSTGPIESLIPVPSFFLFSSATTFQRGTTMSGVTTGPFPWSKVFQPNSKWEDKEQFLDVIYWGRQIAAIVIGIVWGYLGLTGFFGLASFAALNSLLVYIYCVNFNEDTDEDMMEFVKEGFMTALSAFLVAWIMTYSAVFHSHLFTSSVLWS